MGLISAVLNRAVREWELRPSNPMAWVTRPARPQACNERVFDDGVERLLKAGSSDLSNTKDLAMHAFRYSTRTAMRAGEICGLIRASFNGAVAHLSMTKNSQSRDVPLSKTALAHREELPRDCFEMSAAVLSMMFRRACEDAGITGLAFHVARHRAITDMAKKLHVLALAQIVGHTNIAQPGTYYNETPEAPSKLLD